MHCPNCRTWMERKVVVDKYGDRTIIWTCPVCKYQCKEYIA